MTAHELAALAVDTPTGRTWWDVAQQAAGFGIALATLYGLVVRPAIKRLVRHFRAAIAEVVTAQQQTNGTLARVDHQLHPNGGRSAHDYARKAYEEAQAIRAEQRHQGQRQDHMQGELTAQGWRLQEVVERQAQHTLQGRAFLVRAREVFAHHGIDLPADPDNEEVSTT